VDSTGYVTVGSIWGGYGFTISNNNNATTPTCSPATTVTPLCNSAGCTPQFSGQIFGTIGACTLGTSTYQGYAAASWNVNQPRSGTTGGTWVVPSTGGITVTFSNPDNVSTRFQLQDPTGTTQWCSPVQSGVEIPWGAFVTNCWLGGTTQSQLPSGQAIGQAAFMVPQTILTGGMPYNICIQNMTIQ
jgi:hypothetical protein